jgi:hypothetical protein
MEIRDWRERFRLLAYASTALATSLVAIIWEHHGLQLRRRQEPAVRGLQNRTFTEGCDSSLSRHDRMLLLLQSQRTYSALFKDNRYMYVLSMCLLL